MEVNPEKTKYMIMSRDQNIVRNGNIKIGDLSFEEVEKFKYLGATVTNINDTREEIKRRINMGNACYYSVEKLLSSSLLSKNLKVRIYKTVILPVVLYGCETWTLTLREEHRFRVFENKVLRKIFGAKRDEVTGEWRKLHNTELHALYSSPDIIRNIKSRRLRWAGHVARMGESRNAYRVLVGRPEGKRPLGRPRRRWEDNIKMDLREVGYDDRDWINLAQDRDRWRAYDVLIAKLFSNRGLRVKIQYAGEPTDVASLLSVDMYKLAVFLDWQCEGSTAVLKEASERKLFSTLHFWLVFTDRPADSKVTVAVLHKVNIFLDSQFTLVRSGSGKDEFLLQEVYKILDGSSLVITPERGWSLGQRFPAGPPRNDFGGIVFRTAAVFKVCHGTLYAVMWLADEPREFDLPTLPQRCITYEAEKLPSKYGVHSEETNVTQENSWGYPKNATHYDGVVGLLQRGDIELDYKTIKRLHANLIRTGSVTQQKGAGRPKTVITEEAKAAATEAFQRSPKKSIRQYQRESGASYAVAAGGLKIRNITGGVQTCNPLEKPPLVLWVPAAVAKGNELAAMEATLSCEDCDIRMEFATLSMIRRGTFMFLEPSLSEISNIYTLPFSRAVWLAYFVIMIIFTVAMYVSQNAEDRLLNSKQAEPVTMIESIFTSIAVICQEGATRDPKNFSFRILFLSFLMLSLFVTVSYSAIIVSLLQTTSSAIQTFKDLLDSPFKMSMKDFVVNRNYINETTDRDIRALYYKKLYTQPQSEAFTSTEVGVKNVRLGLHAFHGEADAFKIISETFDEYEKCRLKRIKMFSTLQVAFAVPKGSPQREHITRGARWLKESGLSDREYKFWVIQFPKCQGHTESFTSVRIQDFYPALLVLAYGAAISAGILVLEMVYFKIRIDEPREFNLPTLPQRRITYVPEKLPSKYGFHSEEYLPIRTVTPVVAGIFTNTCSLFMVYNTIHMMSLAFDTGIEAFSEVRRNFHSHSSWDCRNFFTNRRLQFIQCGGGGGGGGDGGGGGGGCGIPSGEV
ncbi:hypothetical protein ANN_07409 [Periplaneta americana]|uniref:Ionotropic glutamate receptor C-terminal domain-containing protein n=1 Tax=Periplaneta americana TaxID=6978 RepID=A0ABQ8SYI8_PERAM|nr:hypothetical protein ANN_07409 [Periplaneta americana]